MLGVDAKTFRVAWTVFLFLLLLATIYAIRETIMLIAIAIFFSYMLWPLVNMAERFLPKRRVTALAIVYVLLVGALVTVGVNLGSQIADEASSLFGRLPGLLQQGRVAQLPLPSWLEPLRDKIIEASQHEAASLQTSIVPFLQRASGQIVSGLGSIILVLLVPIISFFLIKDAYEIRKFLLHALEDVGDRILFTKVLGDVHDLLSKYIRALVLLAFASFGCWALFLFLTHAPYHLLLAGIAGSLEFIPGVGPACALGVTLVVCGASGYPAGLVWILVFWVAFRMFQDYVLTPLLMSSGIHLHPLLILLGVIAGEQVGGIPGLFFSVPVIAILKVLFTRLGESRKEETEEKTPSALTIPVSF